MQSGVPRRSARAAYRRPNPPIWEETLKMTRLLALAAVTLAVPVVLGVASAAPIHSGPHTAALAARLPNVDQQAPTGRRTTPPAERLPDLDQETPTALW